jgi:hypothetical protein
MVVWGMKGYFCGDYFIEFMKGILFIEVFIKFSILSVEVVNSF